MLASTFRKNAKKLTRVLQVSGISERVNDKPGPGRTTLLCPLQVSQKTSKFLRFLAKYLTEWMKASPQKRVKMVGNALFSKLQRLKYDHVRHGQYYLEYLKFSCSSGHVMHVTQKDGLRVFLFSGLQCQCSVNPRQESIWHQV